MRNKNNKRLEIIKQKRLKKKRLETTNFDKNLENSIKELESKNSKFYINFISSDELKKDFDKVLKDEENLKNNKNKKDSINLSFKKEAIDYLLKNKKNIETDEDYKTYNEKFKSFYYKDKKIEEKISLTDVNIKNLNKGFEFNFNEIDYKVKSIKNLFDNNENKSKNNLIGYISLNNKLRNFYKDNFYKKNNIKENNSLLIYKNIKKLNLNLLKKKKTIKYYSKKLEFNPYINYIFIKKFFFKKKI